MLSTLIFILIIFVIVIIKENIMEIFINRLIGCVLGTVGVGSVVKQMVKAITKNDMNNNFIIMGFSAIRLEVLLIKRSIIQNIYCNALLFT